MPLIDENNLGGLLGLGRNHLRRQQIVNGLLTSQAQYADLPPAVARPEPGMNWLQSASMATLPIPGVSDALGMLGDAQMFIQRPETRTPMNYALAALPAVPAAGGLLAMMNRKVDPQNVGLLARALPGQAGMTGYHGSPHDFDAFDISKIGTGEGAQAYGHGLYFAESPGVAREYQRMADWQPEGVKYAPGSAQDRAAAWIAEAIDSQSDAPFARAKRNAQSSGAPDDVLRQIDDWWASDQKFTRGRLYTVYIPDEAIDKMLDWDKPLSEQPEAVRRAVSALGEKYGLGSGWGDKNYSARSFYEALSNWDVQAGKMMSGKRDQESASRILYEAGIPGIKYLDAGSRGAGDGTRNFVVFDDKLIKVLKKE